MIVLVQSLFHTNWASLFEMELEPNSSDWNGNELEHKLKLEDMKHIYMWQYELVTYARHVLPPFW